MKYLYNQGIGKQTSNKWVVLPVVLLVLGLYAGFNVLAPIIFYAVEPTDKIARSLQFEQPDPNVDKLYMPKINASITIAPIGTDESTALKNGALSRSIQNGNPKSGGNYILTSNRFSLHLLPTDTFRQSYFYNISSLQVGDDLFVDYKGTRFAYKVESIGNKAATDPSIEGMSEQSKLTLYTTELNGDNTRAVYSAKMVGKVVWTENIPKVEPISD